MKALPNLVFTRLCAVFYAMIFFASCTNSTDFNTPRTITTPIASDTSRPSTGGTSTLRITSFTPSVASTGTLVAIVGSGFRGASAVFFGNEFVASFTVVSDSLITATVGANSTSGTVYVRTNAGLTSLAGFTFVPAPFQSSRIISFVPATGSVGTQVVINGQGFTGTTAVRFGDTFAASFIVLHSTQIIATLSTGATGSVSVTTPTGTASLAGFTFIAAPVIVPSIATFTPTSGRAGTAISITGTGFTGVTAVQVGGVNVRSFTVISPARIDAVIGNGTTGTISVVTQGGVFNSGQQVFTFLP